MKRCSIIFLLFAICMSFLLSGCTSSKETTVKVGNDEMPTLYSAVGERKITGTSKGFENDVRYLVLTYKSGDVSESDIETYVGVLRDEEDFIFTKDSADEGDKITIQLGKESVDKGKIVLIDIEFPQLGSTVIQYRVGSGTITLNDASAEGQSSSAASEGSEQSKTSAGSEASAQSKTSAASEETSVESEETVVEPAKNLSADPFGFEISIDGNVVVLPCQASDLEAIGYSFGDKAGNTLETGYTTSALMKLENGNYISVGIYNDSGAPLTFSKCKVDDIYTAEHNSKGQNIQIANGIAFGATPDEVKAIYGADAQNVYEDGAYLYLTYEKDGDDYANKIQFLFKDNSLYEIDLTTR